MLKIGLTGGIGAGKTTVSDLFAELDPSQKLLAIIDTDIIARQVVELNKPAYNKIVKEFGEPVLNDDKTINRTALAEIIFSDSQAKKILESITHPAIESAVKSEITKLEVNYCIIVIPLLFETRSNYQLDRILLVEADKDKRVERTIKRDGSSQKRVALIIQSQMPAENKRQYADDIIQNNGNREALQDQVAKLHKLYLNLA